MLSSLSDPRIASVPRAGQQLTVPLPHTSCILLLRPLLTPGLEATVSGKSGHGGKEAAAPVVQLGQAQPLPVRARREPLPPLEDAPLPLPPPPLPGRAGSGREERCEVAEIGSAPAPAARRPGLGSLSCAGAARSLGRPVAARPLAARSLALPGARRRSLF